MKSREEKIHRVQQMCTEEFCNISLVDKEAIREVLHLMYDAVAANSAEFEGHKLTIADHRKDMDRLTKALSIAIIEKRREQEENTRLREIIQGLQRKGFPMNKNYDPSEEEIAEFVASRAPELNWREKLRAIVEEAMRYWDNLGQPYPPHLQSAINQLHIEASAASVEAEANTALMWDKILRSGDKLDDQ